MRIYFLRHGEAVEPEDWPGSDESRPLTAAGRVALQREAQAMNALNIHPDAILTSPLIRARQTADVLAEELGIQSLLNEHPLLAPGFGPSNVAALLDPYATSEHLLLVGHEPDFSRTVESLIGGGRVKLAKGGLACLELSRWEPRDAVLLWLATPSLLTR